MNLIDILFIPINKIKKTIGKTDDTGGSSSAGTVMGKLNNIISNNSSSSIGSTTDTGGTSTSGTVFGKLNKLISNDKRLSFKHFSLMSTPNQTNQTILSISGAGEFYSMQGILSQVKIIIDGVEYTRTGGTSQYIFYPSTTNGLSSSDIGVTDTRRVGKMAFSESLIITVDTNATAGLLVAGYALYE